MMNSIIKSTLTLSAMIFATSTLSSFAGDLVTFSSSDHNTQYSYTRIEEDFTGVRGRISDQPISHSSPNGSYKYFTFHDDATILKSKDYCERSWQHPFMSATDITLKFIDKKALQTCVKAATNVKNLTKDVLFFRPNTVSAIVNDKHMSIANKCGAQAIFSKTIYEEGVYQHYYIVDNVAYDEDDITGYIMGMANKMLGVPYRDITKRSDLSDKYIHAIRRGYKSTTTIAPEKYPINEWVDLPLLDINKFLNDTPNNRNKRDAIVSWLDNFKKNTKQNLIDFKNSLAQTETAEATYKEFLNRSFINNQDEGRHGDELKLKHIHSDLDWTPVHIIMSQAFEDFLIHKANGQIDFWYRDAKSKLKMNHEDLSRDNVRKTYSMIIQGFSEKMNTTLEKIDLLEKIVKGTILNQKEIELANKITMSIIWNTPESWFDGMRISIDWGSDFGFMIGT